jgi:polysaccharide biosynthesis PFTS motif protein
MTSYLENIYQSSVKVFGGGNFKILFKMKRIFDPKVFDNKYIEYVDQLKQRPEFEFFVGNTNIFNVFQKADGCISPPFGSPVGASQLLGIPSAFYDSTGKVRDPRYTRNLSPLLSDLTMLENWLKSL